LKLWWRSHTDLLCSWTVVCKELVRACQNLGHEVWDSNETPRFPHQWIEVWWGAPKDWSWSGKPVVARVGLTLSESDQLIRSEQERALENLKLCDYLFVPTQSSLRAFYEMPLDKEIGLWPLGVDTERFQYTNRFIYADETFRFLHLGVTQFRKGSWLVPEAFIAAFDEGDNVELTIASHGKSPMWESLEWEYGNHPLIKFIAEAKENPARHYDGMHVFVSPHLAEGWGLCITEAMSLGMPCLVSRCSAPRDYFKPDFGWWVEMSGLYAPVRQCLTDTPGFWRLPDVHDLSDKMRYAYEHREECECKGKESAAYVRDNLTWEMGVTKALDWGFCGNH